MSNLSSISLDFLIQMKVLLCSICHCFCKSTLHYSPLPSYLQANLDETYAASTLVFPNGNDNGADGSVFYQVCSLRIVAMQDVSLPAFNISASFNSQRSLPTVTWAATQSSLPLASLKSHPQPLDIHWFNLQSTTIPRRTRRTCPLCLQSERLTSTVLCFR